MKIPYAGISYLALRDLALKRGKGSIPEDDKLARLYIEVASINPKIHPVKHAKAFLLRRDGFTHTEIKDILEVSESTAERYLKQFLKYSWAYIFSHQTDARH